MPDPALPERLPAALPELTRALPELTRRALLGRSLAALGVAAGLPGILPASAPAEAAPAGLRVLEAGEWQVLAAVADTVIPRGGAFPLGAADLDLAARIDAFLAAQAGELAGGVRGALLLLEYGAPLLAGRWARFSKLPAADRAEVFAALPGSFGLARRVYAGLRGLCLFAFYAQPESWPAVGYDGPWVERREGPR
jgi:hypothetical protein